MPIREGSAWRGWRAAPRALPPKVLLKSSKHKNQTFEAHRYSRTGTSRCRLKSSPPPGGTPHGHGGTHRRLVTSVNGDFTRLRHCPVVSRETPARRPDQTVLRTENKKKHRLCQEEHHSRRRPSRSKCPERTLPRPPCCAASRGRHGLRRRHAVSRGRIGWRVSESSCPGCVTGDAGRNRPDKAVLRQKFVMSIYS